MTDHALSLVNTIKFLNFRTPENFAVIYLKFNEKGQTFVYFFGIANCEDPDQTAPLSEKLGSLR